MVTFVRGSTRADRGKLLPSNHDPAAFQSSEVHRETQGRARPTAEVELGRGHLGRIGPGGLRLRLSR